MTSELQPLLETREGETPAEYCSRLRAMRDEIDVNYRAAKAVGSEHANANPPEPRVKPKRDVETITEGDVATVDAADLADAGE